MTFQGNVTASGNGEVNVSGGTLTISGAPTVTTLGGSGGSLIKDGSGTLVLSEALNYSGGTTINTGTVSLATTTSLPNGTVVTLGNASGAEVLLYAGQTIGGLAGGGTVSLANACTLTVDAPSGGSGGSGYSGQITGNGNLTVGSGTVAITGTSSDYSGTTTIDAGGTLQLGNGSSNGEVPGGVVDHGSLTFLPSPSGLIFPDVISGDGSVTVGGSGGGGTLILSGNNTYTGGTTLNGVLSVNTSSALGRHLDRQRRHGP